jgi:hypothetical protein
VFPIVKDKLTVVPVVSTVLSGIVPEEVSSTYEYPATPVPPTSVDVVHENVTPVTEETTFGVCVVEVATGFVGAVTSGVTVTVLVALAVFPELSVAVYVTVYVPAVAVLTVLFVVTVSDPSIASFADAPASVYVPPCPIVTGLLPFIVMTGAVVSGV